MKTFNEWLGDRKDESWFGGMFGAKKQEPQTQEPQTQEPQAKEYTSRAYCPFCKSSSAVIIDDLAMQGTQYWHCTKCNREWHLSDAETPDSTEPGYGATFLPRTKVAHMGSPSNLPAHLRSESNMQTLYLSGLISEETYYEAEQGQQPQDDSALVNKMAAGLHDDWRKGRLKSGTHGQADAVYDPRMKPSGLDDGQEIDIAQHYDKLTPKWQAENKAAAETAIGLVRQAIASGKNVQQLSSGADLEALSDKVHEAWMRRNPKADYNAAQHVPYASLPEAEKQKDRDHVLMAIRLLSGQ